MGILEGEKSDQLIKKLFEEIMIGSFFNLVKEKDTQVQEAQGVPNKLDPKRSAPRCLIIKIARLKDKDRILKAKEKSR